MKLSNSIFSALFAAQALALPLANSVSRLALFITVISCIKEKLEAKEVANVDSLFPGGVQFYRKRETDDTASVDSLFPGGVQFYRKRETDNTASVDVDFKVPKAYGLKSEDTASVDVDFKVAKAYGLKEE